MKVLVLTSARREPDFSSVYAELGREVKLDIAVFDKVRQRNLKRSLRHFSLAQYDRVMLDLHFKHIHKQTRFLRSLPGLLIYEEDACQNYLEHSRWKGSFSRFYARLPNAIVVVTGASVAQKLRQEGFSVRFIPKGYDPQILHHKPGQRDIELGFIGRVGSKTYVERKRILDELAECDGLQILRTEPGQAYCDMLNRIRYFISADVGFDEYMAKNFEAMASGCVVFAWRQHTEEAAIGLEDGTHLMLYSSLTELREKIASLRAAPGLAEKIAEQGRLFAETNLTHQLLARHLLLVLGQHFPASTQPTGWRKLIAALRLR